MSLLIVVVFRDEAVAGVLVAGDVDVSVGQPSHGLSAALAARHVLHIQHQLGMHFLCIIGRTVATESLNLSSFRVLDTLGHQLLLGCASSLSLHPRSI